MIPAESEVDGRTLVWRRHFVRAFRDHRRWDNTLSGPSAHDTDRLGQLYADCFTHHNGPRYSSRDGDGFYFQREDPRRLVRKDNLTAFFHRQFLDGEVGYRGSPIFESPNSVDHPRELGEPVTFDHFRKCVSAIPFDPSDTTSGSLGENRLTFLVGEVGVGKTFTISRLIQDLATRGSDADGFGIVPVYVDIETFLGSRVDVTLADEFMRRLFHHLLETTKAGVEQYAPTVFRELLPADISREASSEQVAHAIRHFVKALARNASSPARVVLFIDNLDALHYKSSRYNFFPDEYAAHLKEIEDRIAVLVMQFIDPSQLGECGLCVCIAARTNVARDSRLVNHPAQPRRNELEDHLVFQLAEADPRDVVSSRLNMLEAALRHYSIDHSDDYRDALGILRLRLGESIVANNAGDGLRRVTALCHHGARSLVDFLGRLRLNVARQGDVVDRLFSHSPWLLERVYIADAHERYTQEQDHFPNLFLIDGMAIERKKRVVHKHTYWLKYILLKRIAQDGEAGSSVRDLVEECVDELAYEDGIVRLCLGSLAMVNESRCLELVGPAQDDCHDNLVRLTSRGKVLVGTHHEYQFPYCFELSYLQMVIDDHLLSLPKLLAERIAVQASLRAAFAEGDRYYGQMRENLARTLPATIVFARLLEASWAYECESRSSRLREAAYAPEFGAIYSRLSTAIRGIARQAGFEPKALLSLLSECRADAEFDAMCAAYGREHEDALREPEVT